MAGEPDSAAGLLVIAVDRLPAWILPAYGTTWVAMPTLDGLAARGVVFDRVITPATDPRATLGHLVGRAADERGNAAGPDAGPTPLGAAVSRRGWRAALVTDDPSLTAAEVFGRGDVAERAAVACLPPGPAGGVCDRAGQTAIARLVDAAVAELANGCRCVFCQVTSLGAVWDAPLEYRERYADPEDPPPPRGAAVPAMAVSPDTDPDLVVGYRQVFAGQLTLLDEQVGRLLGAVAAAGGGWTVLIAGLRGLPLGLHGWLGPGGRPLPFGETVHVPAILVDAGERMAGQRFMGLVTPADLGVTLGELAGGEAVGRQVAADRPWSGRSLAGVFDNWSTPPRDRIVVADEAGVAIVTPEWHAVIPRPTPQSGTGAARARIFAKPDDYFELVDLADRRPALTEPLEAAIPSLGGAVGPVEWPAGLWLAGGDATRGCFDA